MIDLGKVTEQTKGIADWPLESATEVGRVW